MGFESLRRDTMRRAKSSRSGTTKASSIINCWILAYPTGRTRTYNPPVNSLVGNNKFNDFAMQMTTHEAIQMLEIHVFVTLI